MPKTMTIESLIQETTTSGYFFSCTFNKKSTGETRTMLCRRGVKMGVTNAPGPNGSAARPAQDKKHDVLTVFDIQALKRTKNAKASFRRINLNGLLYVTHNKTKYKYNNDTQLLIEV